MLTETFIKRVKVVSRLVDVLEIAFVEAFQDTAISAIAL